MLKRKLSNIEKANSPRPNPKRVALLENAEAHPTKSKSIDNPQVRLLSIDKRESIASRVFGYLAVSHADMRQITPESMLAS
jgi:hypothetical protein